MSIHHRRTSGKCHYISGLNVAAGVVFIVTGVAKIFLSQDDARGLDKSDPLFGVSFRHVVFVVALLEIAAAFFCLSRPSSRLATLAVVALSTNFLLYRLFLWSIEWQEPCKCLGNLTESLHLDAASADKLMTGVLVFLLIGGCTNLLATRKIPVTLESGPERG